MGLTTKASNNAPLSGEISRQRAAQILGTSTRSLGRRIEKGDFTVTPNGFLLEEEIDFERERIEADQNRNPAALALQEIVTALASSNGHAERMMQLIEKPMSLNMETQTKVISALVARLDRAEELQVEMMQVLGDHLLQKEERDAIRAASQARSETIREMGAHVAPHIPTLIAQFGGNGPLKKAQEFVSSLDDSDKAGLWELAQFFEDPKKADAFRELLKAMQIKPPEPEPEPEPEIEESEESEESEGKEKTE